MLRRLLALSTLLLLASSCKHGGPVTLRDSEGRSFEATCPTQGPCQLEQKSGPRRSDKPALALLTGGRLVGICDVPPQQGAPQGPFDCRPLSCQSNDDCPPLHEMDAGQCLNGRCSDPAEPIRSQDAIMLCLAGTGLGRKTAAQIERYALALNCGTPCKVPTPCPQP